jgi:hypothetical protein
MNSGVLGNFTSNWTDIIAYSIVDYASEMLLAPIFTNIPAGAFVLNGVNFAMKQSVAQTSPLKGLSSSWMKG